MKTEKPSSVPVIHQYPFLSIHSIEPDQTSWVSCSRGDPVPNPDNGFKQNDPCPLQVYQQMFCAHCCSPVPSLGA